MRRVNAAAVLLAVVVMGGLVRPVPAVAAARAGQPSAATQLADRYAPIVKLSDEEQHCGVGEPFQPTSVDAVLDNPEVALRGPWSGDNLVKVAPTATDLSAGLPGYALDYPGNALKPGCTYADWAQQLAKTWPPLVYAHLVTQPDYPGHLALQYWFFYVFNDFNNKHEGDWEMVQLNFKADTAEQALTVPPYEIGYSQHEGAERATWGSSKLTLLDGTHPVVYPAYGSHANYYSPALYLGRSAAEGVGCDNTLGPWRELRPAVTVIPTSPNQYLKSQPWLGYQGRWGEPHPSFSNGPTGPAQKDRWSAPFTWVADSWRDTAFSVPAGGHLHSATSFFCSAVAAGSNVVTLAFGNPTRVLVVLALVILFLIWLARQTRWGPTQPYRLRRRRAWGAVVTSSYRLYVQNPKVFLGIGVLFIPIGLIVAVAQNLIFQHGPLSSLVQSAGEGNSFVAALVAAFGFVVTILGFTVVQAATAVAVVDLDRSQSVSAREAYRGVLRRLHPLVGSLLRLAVALTLLALTGIGSLLGIWLLVRWSLFAAVAAVDGDRTATPLRRSWRLTRGHWWRTASLGVFVTGAGLLVGPLIGALLLLASNASFNVVNVVAAVIDTAVLPFVAIATTYLYADLMVRERLRSQEPGPPGPLPAEA